MVRWSALIAAACLVVLLAPGAGADAAPDVCYGYPVGWSGYYEHCVHPTRPDCLVETRFWSGADGFEWCTGL